MNELPCTFNPTGIICDGATLCSFCGWNPQEAARRKQRIRALVNAGQRPHVVVRKRAYVLEDWTGYNDPR